MAEAGENAVAEWTTASDSCVREILSSWTHSAGLPWWGGGSWQGPGWRLGPGRWVEFPETLESTRTSAQPLWRPGVLKGGICSKQVDKVPGCQRGVRVLHHGCPEVCWCGPLRFRFLDLEHIGASCNIVLPCFPLSSSNNAKTKNNIQHYVFQLDTISCFWTMS